MQNNWQKIDYKIIKGRSYKNKIDYKMIKGRSYKNNWEIVKEEKCYKQLILRKSQI